MKSILTTFAIAALVGATALGAATRANATPWVMVADEAYDAANVPAVPAPSVASQQEVIVRSSPEVAAEPIWHDREPAVRNDGGSVTMTPLDNCRSHRESSWSGGSYDTRQCY